MSTFARRNYSPAPPAGMAHGSREPYAVNVDVSARAEAGCSPATSSHNVLATLAIAGLLGLMVTARAIVFLRRRHVPGTPHSPARCDRALARSPDAVKVGVSVRAQAASSPTMSIHKVLATLATGLLLSLVLAARAVVHAGAGMPDGAMRALTLAIGQATLQVAEATYLTWPWDRLAAAFGNAPQPALPPLLASGSAATPQRQADPTRPPARGPQAGALLVAAARPPATARRKTPRPLPGPSRRPRPGRQPRAGRRAHAVRSLPERPWRRPYRRRPYNYKGYTPGPQATRPAAKRPPLAILLEAHATAHPPTVVPRRQAAGDRRQATGERGQTDHARAAAVHPDPLWRRTPSHALRLLVTGDSLPGYLGSLLLDEAAAIDPVRGAVDVHDGTGLTRPDFVDWSLVARQQVALYHPDAVVVWMGGNDFQNMTLPDGRFFPAGTPAWTQEYQRRAEICMRIWTDGGARRVYWLSMPPARDPSWAYDDAQIDVALQRAATRVPGAEYLNILGPITDHGRYADYVYEGGQPVQVREADGVHVNLAGSTIVAQEVLRVLEREGRLG